MSMEERSNAKLIKRALYATSITYLLVIYKQEPISWQICGQRLDRDCENEECCLDWCLNMVWYAHTHSRTTGWQEGDSSNMLHNGCINYWLHDSLSAGNEKRQDSSRRTTQGGSSRTKHKVIQRHLSNVNTGGNNICFKCNAPNPMAIDCFN